MNDRTTLWEPGHTLGDPGCPDEFRLEQFIHRGGEGELWRARRKERDGNPTWHAVKILRADAVSSPEALTVWRNRWRDSVYAANEIQLAGLVRSQYMEGVLPHPEGAQGEPGGVYLIGPWQKDARPLDEWARTSMAPPAERLRVLVRLSRIVDDLHRADWVHRDISGGNVLVDGAGNPTLIDLTFLKRRSAGISVLVGTPGYASLDEEIRGEQPSIHKDCLAVGVLARVLLLPQQPLYDSVAAVAADAPEQLSAAGYSDEVVDCLMRALDAEPWRRPSPLLPWAEELCARVAAGPDPGQRCLALSTDVLGRPVVVTGGDRGLNWYTAASPVEREADPAADWVPPREKGPRDVRDLALARDARGELVVAAVDADGTLRIARRDRGWQVPAGNARGLAVLVSPRGEVLLWTAQPEGILRVRLCPDGSPPTQEVLRAAPGSRVLAAAWDADGRAAVLVAEPGRVTHCTWPAVPGAAPEWAAVRAGAAVRGTIGLNRSWGELEAGLCTADGTWYSLSRHRSGAPWDETDASGRPGSHTALRGIRHGVARATAGPQGLAVAIETAAAAGKDNEHVLHTGPARMVGLHAGTDGNLHVAALAGGEIRCWSETWAERWTSTALRPR